MTDVLKTVAEYLAKALGFLKDTIIPWLAEDGAGYIEKAIGFLEDYAKAE